MPPRLGSTRRMGFSTGSVGPMEKIADHVDESVARVDHVEGDQPAQHHLGYHHHDVEIDYRVDEPEYRGHRPRPSVAPRRGQPRARRRRILHAPPNVLKLPKYLKINNYSDPSYVVNVWGRDHFRFGLLPSYLQKRRRRWYAIMEIPVALRTHFRKPRFVQSLESECRTVAERRVLPVVAGWKKEIAAARNEPVDDDAAYWRRALRNARDEEHRQSILEQIDCAAWDIGAINVENIGDAPPSPIGPTSSRQQPTSNGGQTNESARIGMTHRKLLQRKTLDIENEIRGTLKALGLKLGKVSRGGSVNGGAKRDQRGGVKGTTWAVAGLSP